MGTRSKRIWKRLRLGSVTQDVMRRAHCAVILVTARANVRRSPPFRASINSHRGSESKSSAVARAG